MLARVKYQGQLNEYSRFCKKMRLTEERERIYYDMRGRVASRQFRNKTVAVARKLGTIKEKEIFRNTQNTGAFKHLPERMSKKHICEIAKEFNVDLQGLKLNIDFNEELLRIGLAGRADPEEIGGITFFPNSFRNKEELVRTLFHEKQHVE